MKSGDVCFGCSACKTICPTSAIEMVENSELFLVPKINYEKCIACNKCNLVCPAKHDFSGPRKYTYFAGFHQNNNIVLKSASGGAAYALGYSVLSQGGYCCGAIWADNFHSVEHKIIEKIKDLPLLQGSKYVQSTKNVFQDIKSLLTSNQKVMFFGTPCEIAGLKGYLQKGYDNLILCDLICQGNTSPSFLKQYILYYEEKKQSKIKDLDCRFQKSKNDDYENYILHMTFVNQSSFQAPFWHTNLGKAFNIYKRSECYKCPFKGKSVADITLGDCWGIGINYPFYNKAGTSVIICNTEKGGDWIKSLKDFELWETDENVLIGNKNWGTPISKSKYRESFKQLVLQEPFMIAMNNVYPITLKSKIYSKIPWQFKKIFFHSGKTIITQKIQYEKVDFNG